MKGQCRCGVKYEAKKEDCEYQGREHEPGIYYVKCSDCFDLVIMRNCDKPHSSTKTNVYT